MQVLLAETSSKVFSYKFLKRKLREMSFNEGFSEKGARLKQPQAGEAHKILGLWIALDEGQEKQVQMMEDNVNQ